MINTDEVVNYFDQMLEKNGFEANTNPLMGWNIFKQFMQVKINCDVDAVLFECGVYEFTGEELFNFDFVRQFIFNDEDGEYDHTEQFHFTFYYTPNEELGSLEMNKWSYDFDTLDEFFKYIESCKSFSIPIEKYTPQYYCTEIEEV